MGRFITCTSVGRYPLTRGQRYELLIDDPDGQGVVVRDDDGRRRWLPASHFDRDGGAAPTLVAWRFDDPVVDPLNRRDETHNWVDVTLRLDDGTERWCQMMTPSYLTAMLAPDAADPAFHSAHVIFVRDLTAATVAQVLSSLDQQGGLFEITQPFETQA